MEKTRIAVIALGYVGLPLCLEFSRLYPTVGFDILQRRIDELRKWPRPHTGDRQR